MSDCTQCADYEWCAKNEECAMFNPKTMTNADKIRSMSDEELAEWLCDIAGWLPMYEGKMHPILDWLKEEAKP